MSRKPPPDVDICLLLEGTYPYVSGGVSTWVHQIISAYPDWRFGIFLLSGQKDPDAAFKYAIPPNVTVIEELHLFDPSDYRPSAIHRSVPASWNGFYTLLRKLFVRMPDGSEGDFEVIVALMEHIMQQRGVRFEDFYHSPKTWEVLRELYDRYAADDSFIHFFWTSRYLIEPVWKLARALPRVPKAKLYHAACTGYAGFLGSVLSRQTGVPLLLSEHGIYLKERIQDICRSPWIPEFPKLRPTLTDPLGSLRRMWIGFFDVLGRHCYQESAHLVSLFARNSRVQQHFGADADKISLVPNGISTESCDPLSDRRTRRREQDSQSRVVGFLGRVVSIKDVKTLLRAARLVCDALPDAQFLIVGPTGEEPEYHRDCVELTQQLQLDSNVQFLGLQNRDDVLPLMDVMVLTSISEGLPFVVLEAMAAGVPLVSTDVGACRELIEGRPEEAPPSGPCGIIAEPGNTGEIARALVRLLSDRDLQDQMSGAGRQRVRHHYHERDTLDDYRQIYGQLMGVPVPREARMDAPAALAVKPSQAPPATRPPEAMETIVMARQPVQPAPLPQAFDSSRFLEPPLPEFASAVMPVPEDTEGDGTTPVTGAAPPEDSTPPTNEAPPVPEMPSFNPPQEQPPQFNPAQDDAPQYNPPQQERPL